MQENEIKSLLSNNVYHDFEKSQSLSSIKSFIIMQICTLFVMINYYYFHLTADPEMYKMWGEDDDDYSESYKNSSNNAKFNYFIFNKI